MSARMPAAIDVTEEDLRRAWRLCRVVNMTFEAAMAKPALSTALRRVAECDKRRQQRIAEQRLIDRKRAQANDFSDE